LHAQGAAPPRSCVCVLQAHSTERCPTRKAQAQDGVQIAIFSWTLHAEDLFPPFHFTGRLTWISKLSLMRLGFGSSRVLVGMPARSLPKAPSSDRSLRPFASRSPMPSSELSPPPCCIEGLGQRAALSRPAPTPGTRGGPGRRAVRARARQQATPIPDEMSQKAGLW
jgi:hypothetical protein